MLRTVQVSSVKHGDKWQHLDLFVQKGKQMNLCKAAKMTSDHHAEECVDFSIPIEFLQQD